MFRLLNKQVNGGDYPQSYDTKSYSELLIESINIGKALIKEYQKVTSPSYMSNETIALEHDYQVLEEYLRQVIRMNPKNIDLITKRVHYESVCYYINSNGFFYADEVEQLVGPFHDLDETSTALKAHIKRLE